MLLDDKIDIFLDIFKNKTENVIQKIKVDVNVNIQLSQFPSEEEKLNDSVRMFAN